ncbi:MAG: nuclear transport factor 2 family protein, partial [Desulfovibrio sp.]|nr:nuclear transport factor 2 family protein [Desulfovibrio sp.]
FVLTLALACPCAFARADIVDLYTDAVMTGNVGELEKLLAPNFWYIGGNGHIRDKENFIREIRDKELVVDRLSLTNLRETKVGDTRLLTANGTFKGQSVAPRPQGLMRYTMVIADNNGQPQVVLFQATPVIATPTCEDGNCKIK